MIEYTLISHYESCCRFKCNCWNFREWRISIILSVTLTGQKYGLDYIWKNTVCHSAQNLLFPLFSIKTVSFQYSIYDIYVLFNMNAGIFVSLEWQKE